MAKGTKTLNSAIKVDNSGNIYMKGNTAEPADGDVAEGEVDYWVDTSSGIVLTAKARAGGVIVSGAVATLT